jgi:hypothetical protein
MRISKTCRSDSSQKTARIKARFVIRVAVVKLLTIAAFLSTAASANAEQSIVIAGGPSTGLYYSFAQAICKVVDRQTKSQPVKCRVKPTDGSIENLKALRAEEFDFVLAQSDWQRHAFLGTGIFTDNGPHSELRSVFSAYDEVFTVIVGQRSGIERGVDLRGKRVNIGNPGSGHRDTVLTVLDTIGWSTEDFSETAQLNPGKQINAFCRFELDALVYVVGHPNISVKEVTKRCGGRIIPIPCDGTTDTELKLREFIEKNDPFVCTMVPAGTYRDTDTAIESFGTIATLVATAKTDPEKVRTVVQAVFSNVEYLSQLHSAFERLTPHNMVSRGNTASLHPTAEAIYRNRGLIK